MTRLLFPGKYIQFVLALLLFIVSFDLYIRYVIDWGIAHLSILPAEVQKLAASSFRRSRLIRQSITFSFMILLSVTALAYFVRMLEKERQLQQMHQQQLQLELNALKAQLHPHFFFNILNSIYSLALQQSATTAPMVGKLADMMRYMLYETASSAVSLQHEFDFISNYISLQQMRHDTNLHISLDVQGQTGDIQTAPLLLLPFIENAFKHGIDDEIGSGFVEIIIMIEPHAITASMRNSKPLLAGDRKIYEKGVGLTNVQRRLRLLYPGKHTLQVTETELLYTVYLTISLN